MVSQNGNFVSRILLPKPLSVVVNLNESNFFEDVWYSNVSRHSSLSRFKELLAGALVVKIIEYNYGISEKLNGRNQRDPSWLPDVDIGSFWGTSFCTCHNLMKTCQKIRTLLPPDILPDLSDISLLSLSSLSLSEAEVELPFFTSKLFHGFPVMFLMGKYSQFLGIPKNCDPWCHRSLSE